MSAIKLAPRDYNFQVLSQRLRFGALMLCAMFSSWAHAEIWHSTPVSAMRDVAVAPNGLIWLVGKNGAIWSSADDGTTFSQDEHAKGIENIAAGRGGAWAVGSNGTLWRKLSSPQF